MTFQRVRLREHGPLSTLELESSEVPTPEAGEVLVRVEAAAVNPVDWKLILGHLRAALPVPLPYTPGCDVAGRIVALGADVQGFAVGDAVFGYPSLFRGGGFGEYVLLREEEFAAAPQGIALRDAAAYPVAAVTAYVGLFEVTQLQAGERLLVLGGAGAVGSMAVQMGLLHGAEVYATTSPRNLESVAASGARAIDYTRPLAEQVRDVDFVLDTVGGAARQDALATLKPGGRIHSPVWPAPERSELEARALSGGSYGIVPNRRQLEIVRPWIEDGRVRMPVEAVYALSDVVRALEQNAQGRTRGKILLAMPQ